MKKSLFCVSVLFSLFILTSCDMKNPLYGRWTDSYGNTLILNDSKQFMIVVTSEDGESVTKEIKGSFVVDLNTIIMQDETTDDAEPMLYEWDVQDKLLYLTYKEVDNGLYVPHYLLFFKYGAQVAID